MTPSPKTLALRYRIWAFASAREWDVTTREIAEALGEPWQRVRNALVNAGWSSRVRGMSGLANDNTFNGGAGATRAVEAFVIRDVLAGRVNSEFTA